MPLDLSPSDEQQQLIDAFAALYDKESPAERVRAAEPEGHDAELWRRLIENGAVEMAVGEEQGGGGATVLDLALVAEQHGRHLGSAPLLEAQVVARLLGRLGGAEAGSLLVDVIGGDRLVTLALRPPRAGVLTMVPAGAVADVVVFADGDQVLVVDRPPATTPVANLGSLPAADVPVSGAHPLATGPAAREAAESALDEWLVLMAAAMVGLGGRALEIGVAYVKERHAFGVPIGSFQAVAHGLADAATLHDGAELLEREAAWAAGEEPARFGELAALAFGFCVDAARQAAYRSLHYHGGYGFMLETDIQLFWRRATAWPAQYGEPDLAFARAEARRLGMSVEEA
ncbi:MAG: acyl-CoA dehydrogenase family protein [Acidimicrobiales bacterium]